MKRTHSESHIVYEESPITCCRLCGEEHEIDQGDLRRYIAHNMDRKYHDGWYCGQLGIVYYNHIPKVYRLTFRTEYTGDYAREFCEECYKKQDKANVIEEMNL